MSVSASIDVSILKNDKYDFSVEELLNTMISKNWRIKEKGKICYLPLEDELFDWKEEAISEIDLMKIISKKEQNKETIGVILYWKNTNIGVSMLIFQNYQVTFNIMINRLKLDDINIDVTDVNWYFKEIIGCFDKFKIQEINFNQTW